MELSDYGKVIECQMNYTSAGPQAKHPFTLFIPDGYNPDEPCAVLLHFDSTNVFLAKPWMELRDAGKAPNFIMIGMPAGRMEPAIPEGYSHGLRTFDFDDFGPAFPNYVVDELFPVVSREYNINISKEPIHFVGGASSGACCAWNFLWFRNDLFRRGFLSSPSFVHMRDMDRHLDWMRKFETKPIRVVFTVADDEPNTYFGSSHVAGFAADRAMKYAGYDYIFEYAKGEGHCARCCEVNLSNRIIEYTYADWTAPLKPLYYPERFKKTVDTSKTWEACDAMPDHTRAVSGNKEYTTDGKTIYCSVDGGEKFVAAEGFDDIREIAVSGDLWRVYVADREALCIYGLCMNEDGTLESKYAHGRIEPYAGYYPKGASGLCVDTAGRIYAATQLGVQVVMAFGFVDIIIPAPGDLPIEEIAFGGEDNGYLYIRTENGIYRRKMNVRGRVENSPIERPTSTGYFSM